jgi:O-antigen/teichoic acid export membrane protein
MKSVTAAIAFPAQILRSMRNIRNDALYRGSLFLLTNTVAMSALGFAFWTVAAQRYSATTIGVFSGLTSGVTLLAAIAALGLPITMTRHIASAENPRGLILMAIIMITTAGTALCLATVLFLAPHLPSALHIKQHGEMAFLVTVLVVFTALGGTLDAGLIATRSTRILLIKNLVSNCIKLVAMIFLITLRSSGLLISLGLALVLAVLLSLIALSRRIKGKWIKSRPFQAPWRYLSITSGNYLATVIGILPLSIVPIEVLAVRGAAQTARFSIAFLIAGFLNFIPATMGQALFAETARREVPLGVQFRKALRGVYGILLPSLVLLLVLAPFVLRLFGRAYATDATSCLRVLALSALPAGGTYLIDSLLIARDRTTAYTFMQIANAALVLGMVGVLLPRGLTAAACGWALAQVLTLVVGLLVLATGRLGRHHLKIGATPVGTVQQHPGPDQRPRLAIHAFEPRIRELLATWPAMPTTLIAQRIGWDHSYQMLLEQVAELRPVYSPSYQHVIRTKYMAGQTAQCGLWFPPIEVPVGFGQTRSANQLPVLTMITGYSHWLSAILIPSRRAEDLLAGWWGLIAELGAVPHMLTWHSKDATGWLEDRQGQVTAKCEEFCRSLSTSVVVCRSGDPITTGLIERAQAHLERSFLPGRTFNSPKDFNVQLHDWLITENTRRNQQPRYSPAVLIATDRQAMLPLPPIPPSTGLRLPVRVGNRPFIHFDSNEYSVHPALTGRIVELVANLRHVWVLYDGKVAAEHDRAWAAEQTICDPAHGIPPHWPHR